MKERLVLAAAQMDCIPGAIDANLDKIHRLAQEAANRQAELVVFPELCTTGYYHSHARFMELAHTIPGPVTEQLGDSARSLCIYLMAGIAERDGDVLYNTALLFSPEGELLSRYRKVNLPDFEKNLFIPGDSLCIADTELGPVGMMTCYDHIFPEYVRALALKGPRLLLHGSVWAADDSTDAFGWDGPTYQAIVRIRALENTVFIVSSNRCGKEGPLRNLGHTCIASPWGQLLAGMGEKEEGVITAEADFSRIPIWIGIADYRRDRKVEFFGRELDF